MDAKIWVFDAGESTQHQFMNPRCKLSMGKVDKIFITHMHGMSPFATSEREWEKGTD